MTMERDEDIQILGSVSEHLVQLLNEEKGSELTIEYLRADFLASAAISLSRLRHDAGLTQAQIAEKLHTKQSAIARLEADFDGAMSLRRYVDFALACGLVPYNFAFVPITVAREFVIKNPEIPLTFENHQK
jgi:DNA-binding XRE family transcriptional regulator